MNLLRGLDFIYLPWTNLDPDPQSSPLIPETEETELSLSLASSIRERH